MRSKSKGDKERLEAADNRSGFRDSDIPLGVVDTEKADEFKSGPLSVLVKAVESESQILIKLRNSRALLARIKAFDRHWNMVRCRR